MIKRFKEYLVEYLTDKQKSGFLRYANREFNIGETPSRNARNISKDVIPEGKDTIKIPVMSNLMHEVHDHITKNGFSGMDYGRQIAYKSVTLRDGSTKQTEVKLGKALNATGASKELIGRFANDNHAESAELSNKHQIIISRNPLHIAEKSTNKIWSSCARLDANGKPAMVGQHCGKGHAYAAEKLPHDIHYGTHVAYLVDRDDTNERTDQDLIDNASARISLKPFHGHTGTAFHTILSPENKTYFSGYHTGIKFTDGFKDTLHHFVEKHFPLKDNVIYRKDTNLYNDDGNSKLINFNISKPMPSWSGLKNHHKAELIHDANISPQQIDDLLTSAKNNPGNFNKDQFDMMSYLHKNESFNKDIHGDHLLHPNIFNNISSDRKKSIIEDTLYDTSSIFPKELKSEKFNKLFDLVHNHIKQHPSEIKMIEPFLEHTNFDTEHMNQILHSGSEVNIHTLLNNHTLKAKHIHQILDNPKHIDNFFNFALSGSMLHQTNFNDEHLAKLTSPKIYNDVDGVVKDNILTYLHNTGKIKQFIDNIPNHKESYEPILRGYNAHHFLVQHGKALARPEVFAKLHNDDKEKIVERLSKVKEAIPQLASNTNAFNTLKNSGLI